MDHKLHTDEPCHSAKVKPNRTAACKRREGTLLYLASTGLQARHCALAVPFKREVDWLKGAQRTTRTVRAEGNKTHEKELKDVFEIGFGFRNTKPRRDMTKRKE